MRPILIAEDEPRIAAFMKKGLQRFLQATVEVEENGNTVLGKVTHGNFELLLLDLGLPGKDGVEILKELRQKGLDLSVIVMTARAIDPQDNDLAKSLDAEIIGKPFRMTELVQKVKAACQNP
ncbi:MAG: response regulator [Cyanobacteria bacterium P01_H01_bin.58]